MEAGGGAGKETQDKWTISIMRRRRNTVLLPCLAYKVIEAGWEGSPNLCSTCNCSPEL